MDERIFVTVPTYRDHRCSTTLYDLYANADKPGLIYTAVLDQHADDTDSCHVPDKWSRNVRRTSMPHEEAKGPLFARQLLCDMYQGETYFMMIDAHMKFAMGWDTKLKGEYAHLKYRCGVARPIISAYTPPLLTGTETGEVYHICKSNTHELFRYPGASSSTKIVGDDRYSRTPYLSCHYCFSSGALCDLYRRALAWRGHTFRHVFWGEEALLACVAYTNGYDVYTPPRAHASHAYGTLGGRKSSWRDSYEKNGRLKLMREQQHISEASIAKLMDPTQHPARPLERSVREFWLAAGFVLPRDEPPTQAGRMCEACNIAKLPA